MTVNLYAVRLSSQLDQCVCQVDAENPQHALEIVLKRAVILSRDMRDSAGIAGRLQYPKAAYVFTGALPGDVDLVDQAGSYPELRSEGLGWDRRSTVVS